MKKTTIMFAIIALFALALQPVNAELIGTESSVDASLLYYQPVPAHPGDELDVWIQVTNAGGKASKTGTLSILDSKAFEPSTASDRMKQFPPIPAQESFLAKVKVRVAKDANEGTNNLKVRVQMQGNTDFIERNLPITIIGRSSALSVISAKTTPEEIMPGDTGTLSITVKNVGETKLRNAELALDLTTLGLVPTSGSSSKTIELLAGGATHTYSFDLTSLPDAEPKAYQVPITLNYDDEQGNSNTQEEQVGIVIGAKPELLVYFDSIDLTQEKKTGDVVIRFVNKGLSEVKLLEMEVIESDGLKVTSETPVVYVGNIDEDDYESAEITIQVTENDLTVPLHIAYKDALNREYEENINLELNLESGNGKNSNNSMILFVVAILVIVGLVWWWRSSNAKKRRRK